MKSYHVGLLKEGKSLIVEIADSVDQLSCELYKYLGERQTNIAHLTRNKAAVLASVNADLGKDFERISVRRIGRSDFTAGHIA